MCGIWTFTPAKNKRVALAQILRPRLFENGQVTAGEKKRIVRGQGVPASGVQVVNAVSEGKAEARRPMSFFVSIINGSVSIGGTIMQWLFLVAAVVGTLLPLSYLFPFLLTYGLDLDHRERA